MINRLLRVFKRHLGRRANFSSADYWQRRYDSGGDSGPGSYNHLARFKTRVLNDFTRSETVDSVIEFGCGDGNQLADAVYPSYRGYDVSDAAIAICRERYRDDPTKQFANASAYAGETADLALSLDVIFHLTEDAIFVQYMTRLFNASTRFVIIYSSNMTDQISGSAVHVKHRKFTDWIAENMPQWTLIRTIPNEYPYNGDYKNTSFSDFFIFQKNS